MGRWISALLFLANYSNAQQSWYVGHFLVAGTRGALLPDLAATLLLVRSNRKGLALVIFAICFVDVWRMVDYTYHLTWGFDRPLDAPNEYCGRRHSLRGRVRPRACR
jgi:hypothetical protein